MGLPTQPNRACGPGKNKSFTLRSPPLGSFSRHHLVWRGSIQGLPGCRSNCCGGKRAGAFRSETRQGGLYLTLLRVSADFAKQALMGKRARRPKPYGAHTRGGPPSAGVKLLSFPARRPQADIGNQTAEPGIRGEETKTPVPLATIPVESTKQKNTRANLGLYRVELPKTPPAECLSEKRLD